MSGTPIWPVVEYALLWGLVLSAVLFVLCLALLRFNPEIMLQTSATVRGILPDCLVTVVGMQWFGSEALKLTYKNPRCPHGRGGCGETIQPPE